MYTIQVNQTKKKSMRPIIVPMDVIFSSYKTENNEISTAKMPMVFYYIIFGGCVSQNDDGSRLVGSFVKNERKPLTSGILYRIITERLW